MSDESIPDESESTVGFTLPLLLKSVPAKWRNSFVMIAHDGLEGSYHIKRIAFHKDTSGRCVIVFYKKEFNK